MSALINEPGPDAGFDFSDLKPQERRVVSPHRTRYILREASAGASVSHENARLRSTRVEDGEVAGFGDMFDSDLALLGSCLHPCNEGTWNPIKDKDGAWETTDPKIIRNWPDAFYRPLLDWLKEVSPGLTAQDKPEVLEKQIAKMQKRLNQLRKNEADKTTDAKN